MLHGRGDECEVNRTFTHIHGFSPTWKPRVADLFCFDPKKNEWEQKASTSTSHFGSSLLVENDKLYVAGGNCSIGKYNAEPCGGAGSVEVYDEKNNTWSVVDQPHIPPNNLGAIEVEGSVYFIINSFLVDSGIRIPPGEVYSVSLDEWEDLGRVHQNAILCLVPVKTESLTSELLHLRLRLKTSTIFERFTLRVFMSLLSHSFSVMPRRPQSNKHKRNEMLGIKAGNIHFIHLYFNFKQPRRD